MPAISLRKGWLEMIEDIAQTRKVPVDVATLTGLRRTR